MWVILDLAVLATIAVCILICYKKGFISSMIKVGAFILALVLAFWLSSVFAPVVYDNFVKDSIVEKVNSKYDEDTGLIAKLVVKKMTEEGKTPGNYAESAIRESTTSTIRSLLFVGLYLALYVALRLVSKMLKGVNKIPLVGGLNKFLGGAMGLVVGVLVVYIAVSVLAIFIISPSSNGLFGVDTAEQSLLFSLFYKNSLFKIL